ncbi:MAG TPA: SIS domain-containing protein, partial [Anaerolineaceae bacterium]|nr:SIS domain-containing protein [Anaerolineaceae bacterium]
MGEFTRQEIFSQPEVWRNTLNDLRALDLQRLPQRSDYQQVIFTGCGSTHYLSIWAARLCQQYCNMPV